MAYIGEALQKKGLITPEQLKEALDEQRRSGNKIGQVLIKKGYISEDAFTSALSQQIGIPVIDIFKYEIDVNLIKLFQPELVLRYKFIPIYKAIDALTVAMDDPLDVVAVDEIKKICGFTIKPVLAKPSSINSAIKMYYEKEGLSMEGFGVSGTLHKKSEVDLDTLVQEATEISVVSLVNAVFSEAVKLGASDIHLEPEEKDLYVRLRIDGVLQETNAIKKEQELAVISRIKILAEMDIAERRLPQDGRIKMTIMGKEIDLRISSFPTIYGENICIRILDKSQAIFKLENLGFQPDVLNIFKEELKRPYGIVLSTGPTGSGKTTTLYAVLNLINDLKKDIITLEDPIEYVIPRVRQSQVNIKAGLTFATGLRAILRQDPDIIMVGEIRDLETAEIAIHSALTGHLVFSTLHTNDAASAITRLIDMGIEPFLIASSFCGILAQRLVRRICLKCKKEYRPSQDELASLGLQAASRDYTFYKGTGCIHCHQMGYKGRIGIFELLILNDEIRELIVKKSAAHQIKDAAVKNGMRILGEDGIAKIIQGITTTSEVLCVTKGT